MRASLSVSVLAVAASGVSGPVSEGVVRAPDGVPIAYDVRGSGDTALVFVHCWSCQRSFWREQLDAFADEYRVVSLDLPGHGASGAERKSWSITGLADDVAAVVDELGLQRVILVGHSMGGPVSLAAARRLRGRALGVACVDTLHDAELEFPPGMLQRIAAQFEADFSGSMERMVGAMFPRGSDPELIRWVVERASETDRDAAVALFGDFDRLSLPELFQGAGVPIRCVNAAPATPEAPKTAVETNRRYADYDAVLLEGVGHYLQLERPAEFNGELRRLLRELDAGER